MVRNPAGKGPREPGLGTEAGRWLPRPACRTAAGRRRSPQRAQGECAGPGGCAALAATMDGRGLRPWPRPSGVRAAMSVQPDAAVAAAGRADRRVVALARDEAAVIAFRLVSAGAWSSLLCLWPVWLVPVARRAVTSCSRDFGSARSAGSLPPVALRRLSRRLRRCRWSPARRSPWCRRRCHPRPFRCRSQSPAPWDSWYAPRRPPPRPARSRGRRHRATSLGRRPRSRRGPQRRPRLRPHRHRAVRNRRPRIRMRRGWMAWA
jgi:hypothetical protein